jgi:hypothetical protein
VTVPDILGTIPQWITAGGVMGFFGMLIRWHLGQRKLSIEARKVEVTAAEIANRDKADERDHFSEEMSALRENVSRLREELHTCEEECAAKIKVLQEEVWGEKRQRVAEQISFINLILKSVDAPELKTLLMSLESVQRHISTRSFEEGKPK